MNKQNLWFLTLFSLVLVLGIYYVTMPNELLMGKEDTKVAVKKTKPKAEKTVKVTESSTLEAMRVSLTESRKEQINSFIEDIRNAREYMKLLLDKQVLVGNLSEFIDIFVDTCTNRKRLLFLFGLKLSHCSSISVSV